MSPAPARYGLTLPLPGLALHDHEPHIRAAEAAGYEDLWTGETSGPDGFTPLVLAAAWTERVRLGTGVVNVFTRGPAVLAQHAAALQDASRGRFVLGIGSSSNVIVERWNAIPFQRPLTRVREAVEALRPVLAGERGIGGFRLDQPPQPAVPIYVAALRGRMLELAGGIADGAWVNFLPLAGATRVVDSVRSGAEAAGRQPGDVDIVCRFFCIPSPEEDGALALARQMFTAYATVPVYTEFFRWLGYAEQIDPMVAAWREGDRKRALELAPDDLIREIFIFGSAGEQHERLARYAEAGIRSLCLTPIVGPEELAATIAALAPPR